MGRILISTLGVNDYVACNYLFGDTKIENMRFIQEATIRNYCAGWSKKSNDRVCILCTEESEKKNWLDNGHKPDEPCVGLKNCIDILLKEKKYSELAECADKMFIRIADGNSEKQIWEIFQVVFELIQDGDDIYFDITHGFRSLPMLALVVLQYAKQLRKNINIKVISYGAFETLGPTYKVKDLPLCERNAPVFDLTGFVQLMDWTNAAKDFVEIGNTTKLTDLLGKEVKSILIESRGTDPEAKWSRAVANGIKDFASVVSKNDLSAIIEFSKLKNHLENYRNEAFSGIKAFVPIVEKIANKIQPFEENSLGNVFAATRWCVNHGMFQNAYSILLEGCISIALNSVGQTKNVTFAGDSSDVRMDIENKRELVKFAAQVKAGRKKETDLNDSTKHLLSLLIDIMAILPCDIANYIVKLSNYRNGYMHCGTGTEPVPKSIIEELSVFLPNLETWYTSLKSKIND